MVPLRILIAAAILSTLGAVERVGLPPLLYRSPEDPQTFLLRDGKRLVRFGPTEIVLEPGSIHLTLEGKSPTAQPVPLDTAPGRVNRIIGNDPTAWMRDAPVYSGLIYREVYPGIDMIWRIDGPVLKSEFVVRPGANPASIRLCYSGQRSLKRNRLGALVLTTADGVIEEQAPTAFTLQPDGTRHSVPARFRIGGPGRVGFEASPYDRAATLVIDPVLSFSTFLGGTTNQSTGTSIAVDTSGNAYVAGWTLATDFPVTGGLPRGSGVDAFVAKFTAANQLAYCTYLGGSGDDRAQAIAVDASGNAVVTGATTSPDFPIPKAFQQNLRGSRDAFVAKLSAAGNALVFGSYFGGAGDDSAAALTLDASGNIYVAGNTSSSDLPVAHAFQSTLAGQQDGFVFKMDPSGATVPYSTYFGGLKADTLSTIAMDAAGNVYVGGSTSSSNLPVTAGPRSTIPGQQSGFVSKFASGGQTLVYSFYLGGSGGSMLAPEAVNGIAVDPAGNAFATGVTSSTDFPLVNPYQTISFGGTHGFVTKINPAGNALLYSTYLGGSGKDWPMGIAVSPAGSIYVSGFTSSIDFPVQNAAQAANSGLYDGFVTRLDVSGTLLHSTYLGGGSVDSANAIAVDSAGNILIAGHTTSANFPVVAPFQGTNGAGYSAFMAKYADGCQSACATLTPASGSGASQTYTFTFYDASGYADIAGAQIVINSTLQAFNSCYVLFTRPDQISLAGDTGVTFTTSSLGAPSVLQNSQCVVLASQTTQAGAGDVVTLNLAVAFKTGFAGDKKVWTNYNTNAGVPTGWVQQGLYSAVAPPQGLTAASATPSSGSGFAQAFTFNYFDPYGAPDISGAQILFNSSLTGANGCYVLFSSLNQISLANDNATAFTTATFGQQTVLQNSQCVIYVANSYQSQSGQNLSVTLFIAFKTTFSGSKKIYSSANTNAGTNTGFSQLGSWTVPAGTIPLAVNGFQMQGQSLTFVYSGPNGFTDIGSTQVSVGGCAIQFTRATNTIALGSSTATLGQATALQNSQCIVNAASSYQFGAGNYLNLTLFVTITGSGTQTISSSVNGGASTQVGVWNVNALPAMLPLSAAPFTGAAAAGAFQSFTFTLADPAGADDISGALLVLNAALQGANGCYILWGHASGLLSLANDSSTSFTSGALGSTGLLSNNQCVVDPAKSFAVQAGNYLNLTIAVSFRTAYRQFAAGVYAFVNVQNQAHALSGWQVQSRFTVQ